MKQPTIIIPDAFVTADPEIRATQSGRDYLTLRYHVTPSRKNRQTGQWENGETQWWQSTFWNPDEIDYYMRSLCKGMRIRVEGVLDVQAYTSRDGTPTVRRAVMFPTISSVLKPTRAEDDPAF